MKNLLLILIAVLFIFNTNCIKDDSCEDCRTEKTEFPGISLGNVFQSALVEQKMRYIWYTDWYSACSKNDATISLSLGATIDEIPIPVNVQVLLSYGDKMEVYNLVLDDQSTVITDSWNLNLNHATQLCDISFQARLQIEFETTGVSVQDDAYLEDIIGVIDQTFWIINYWE